MDTKKTPPPSQQRHLRLIADASTPGDAVKPGPKRSHLAEALSAYADELEREIETILAS